MPVLPPELAPPPLPSSNTSTSEDDNRPAKRGLEEGLELGDESFAAGSGRAQRERTRVALRAELKDRIGVGRDRYI